jgi:hypothetical protein
VASDYSNNGQKRTVQLSLTGARRVRWRIAISTDMILFISNVQVVGLLTG